MRDKKKRKKKEEERVPSEITETHPPWFPLEVRKEKEKILEKEEKEEKGDI